MLGTLGRARVTGVVRLTERGGPTSGRAHGIHLSQGSVVAVESQAVLLPLGEILRQRGLLDGTADRQLRLRLAAGKLRTGEILVEERLISPAVLGAALRQQLRARLEALFRLPDASITFHVACPPPRGAVAPLVPSDYLRGRPRARDRAAETTNAGVGYGSATAWRATESRKTPASPPSSRKTEALHALGLDDGATLPEVVRTFRSLASRVHPDRFAAAGETERRAAEERFARLSAAYHTLVG